MKQGPTAAGWARRRSHAQQSLSAQLGDEIRQSSHQDKKKKKQQTFGFLERLSPHL